MKLTGGQWVSLVSMSLIGLMFFGGSFYLLIGLIAEPDYVVEEVGVRSLEVYKGGLFEEDRVVIIFETGETKSYGIGTHGLNFIIGEENTATLIVNEGKILSGLNKAFVELEEEKFDEFNSKFAKEFGKGLRLSSIEELDEVLVSVTE